MARIISVVHFYPPYKNAGSERMLHTMNRALIEADHEVEVIVTSMPEAGNDPYVYDGITVTPGQPLIAGKLNPDVLVSHHQNARTVIGMARVMGCKSCILLHNDFPQSRSLLQMRPDLTVFNTRWLAEKFGHMAKEQNTMVFHPPVWAIDHFVPQRGECLTLVNLNKDKGSEIFYAIAQAMPDLQFLGVIGAHGEQHIREDIPNVEIMEHQEDMRRVWERTAIVLMPSIYESYGMVGPEAMASGIPVIATATAGLKESLGSAGYFVRRKDLTGWQLAIRMILSNYKDWTEQAFARSRELNPGRELEEWVAYIEAIC